MDDTLLTEARAAAANAQVPYSHFPVGAAVETADGQVIRGCNIESASYGLTMCAERVALFNTLSRGAVPRRLAVSCLHGDPAQPRSLMPCGACRQVIADWMPDDAEVLVDGVGTLTVADLLPRAFRLPLDE